MKTKLFKTIDEALSGMPSACIGNHDPLQHRTFGDLAWCAQHEIDMYEEGEETDIKSESEARSVRQFRDRCLASCAAKE